MHLKMSSAQMAAILPRGRWANSNMLHILADIAVAYDHVKRICRGLRGVVNASFVSDATKPSSV